jgi:hypothetical protein
MICLLSEVIWDGVHIPIYKKGEVGRINYEEAIG